MNIKATTKKPPYVCACRYVCIHTCKRVTVCVFDHDYDSVNKLKEETSKRKAKISVL